MKRIWLLLPVGLLSAGCAILGPAEGARYEVDSERVAAVEHAARQAGVTVHWVSYPRKKVAN